MDEEENNTTVQTNIKLEHGVQHQLHLVRFDLMQFVNGLHQYIMTRVRTQDISTFLNRIVVSTCTYFDICTVMINLTVQT